MWCGVVDLFYYSLYTTLYISNKKGLPHHTTLTFFEIQGTKEMRVIF